MSLVRILKNWVINFLFNHIYSKSKCSIYYTTYDNELCDPSILIYKPFGDCGIVSNTMSKFGIGRIKFDRPLSYIGSYTFYEKSNLKTICIPKSITKIDPSAFNNTLTGFHGKFSSKDHRSLINGNELIAVALEELDVYEIPSYIEKVHSNFMNLKRNNLIIVINKYVSDHCHAFAHSTFQLYSNIDHIPEYAFKYNEFSKIVLLKNTKSLGDRSFMRSEGVFEYDTGKRYNVGKDCPIICESSTPPYIGSYVFCSIAPGTDDDWEMDNFYYENIYVPEGSSQIYKRIWCDYSDYIKEM